VVSWIANPIRQKEFIKCIAPVTPLQKGYLTAEIAEIAAIFKNQFKISYSFSQLKTENRQVKKVREYREKEQLTRKFIGSKLSR